MKIKLNNRFTRNRASQKFALSSVDSHIIDYPTLSNLTYFLSFGSFAGICLVIQILAEIFLAIHYIPYLGATISRETRVPINNLTYDEKK
jgi:quinol-cytochrome oxidoreductase complex cytochrome b subunit